MSSVIARLSRSSAASPGIGPAGSTSSRPPPLVAVVPFEPTSTGCSRLTSTIVSASPSWLWPDRMSLTPMRSSSPKKLPSAGRRMFASTTTTCWPARVSATARFATVVDVPSSSEALVNMITFMPRRSVVARFSLKMR